LAGIAKIESGNADAPPLEMSQYLAPLGRAILFPKRGYCMSNAAGLVRDTSKALFVKEASLAVQMRFLRQGGLIPTGGRGTGGYAMRPKDAAALLVAAAATSALKDTAEVTEAFLNLPMKHWEGAPRPSSPSISTERSSMPTRTFSPSWATLSRI
jgi:hypothetical protein